MRTVTEAGEDAVHKWQEMKVERLENIVQEINQTGESLISHLSPARHGEMIERSQEVVKYQI